MKKYFVVSDIHSYYTLLRETLNDKGFDIDNPDHYIILCGDLFDRGLESLELLKFVQSLGDRFIYVRGNHEDLLFDAYNEVVQGFSISSHHISNGTVDTITQLTGVDRTDLISPRFRSQEITQHIIDVMVPILKWIQEKVVDYYELDNYIFVHGWIPCNCSASYSWEDRVYTFNPDWNKKPDPNDATELFRYNSKWKEARWINGMDAWYQGVKIPDKTIVCGHWHVSFYWSFLKQKYKEFPPKNRKNWQKSFQIVEDKGIIALDACTAYSGIVNCKVIEIDA